MATPRHTIDQILLPFFAALATGKKGLTLRRIQEVERHLRLCGESEAERVLIESNLAVIALSERNVPVRDVGAILGVSHQRAHQLVRGGAR
jgi:hypothetical protein